MSAPHVDAWEPWSPAEIAQRLEPLDIPWCVGGGWAIDLFIGEVTRDHEDIEIGVLAPDYATVRDALDDLDAYTPVDGELRPLGPDERPPGGGYFQTWMADAESWRVDVMLEPGDATTWVYRRDERVTAPRSLMIWRSPDGIPYLAPHGALFFKAKADFRPKDQVDFDLCLPRLSDASRTWIVDALAITNPQHPWVERLIG